MSGHKDRSHALLSASGAHRWMQCPPSARLEEQFPDTGSEAAEEGTLAHELAELKVRHYAQTVDFGKQKYTRAANKLKKDPHWKDEMEGYTEEYLEYVKALALRFAHVPTVKIEERLDLGAYVPEGFGTADCILLGGGELHIVDFKYGQGVPVSPERNPQLSLYALGAYEAYKLLYPIKQVTLHIVQPRVEEGGSSWSCTLEELLVFGEQVKEKAALAFAGEGGFHPNKDTCQFCRAKGRCRARAEKNVELAFAVGRKPPLITNEEMGRYLAQGEDVARWLKDLQEIALRECLSGREVPGWKAVEGRSLRDWTDMDAAFQALQENGVPEALLWERKPLTLAQVEKVVGKKEFAEYVGEYVTKPPGKPALVKESDKREAITNVVTAGEAFKEENI